MPHESDFDATPLTDLQLALSKAVDLARAIPPGGVNTRFHLLCRTYLSQIDQAVAERK